jgi:hypothetical protein
VRLPMMPCESWNAREAALLRMERASARTMAEEMAARWCGKKDWGEARPSPYWEESCPAGGALRGLSECL